MRFKTGFRNVVLAFVLAVSTGPAASPAEVAVPQGVQATLTVRILEYDRALRTWSGGQLVVGVIAKRPGGAADLAQALGGRDVQGVSIRVAQHVFRDAEGLRAWIEKSGVRLLYVAEDMGAETPVALAVATGRKLPSLVANRKQFEAGATVGLVVRDGKPHILVNLPVSRSAGMDLDPKLLQLAEVVR
jgi:hypothetical protein